MSRHDINSSWSWLDVNWREYLYLGGLWAFLIQGAGLVLGFGLNVELARLMGASEYGGYNFLISAAVIAAVVARAGMDTGVVKFIPEYVTQGEKTLIRGVVKGAFRLPLLISLIVGSITIAILFAVKRLGMNEISLAGSGIVLIVTGTALIATGKGVLRGFGAIAQSQIPDFLLRPLVIATIAALLVIVVKKTLTSSIVLFVTGVVLCISAAVSWYWIRRLMKSYAPGKTVESKWKIWLSVSLPLFGIGAMNMLIARTDIIILGLFRPNPDVAYYAAATRLGNLVPFGLAAINTIAAPIIAAHYAAGRLDNVRRVFNISLWVATASGLALALPMAFAGKLVLDVFGSHYSSAWPALLILLGGQMFGVAVGPTGYLLSMTGDQIRMLRIMSESAFLNIAIGLATAAVWGAEGVAFATTVALIWWNARMIVHIRKRFGWRIYPGIGCIERRSR